MLEEQPLSHFPGHPAGVLTSRPIQQQQPMLMDREQSMAEQVSAQAIDLYQVARIVGSYVRHHQIEQGQLIRLIVEVHRAFAGLGQAAPPAPAPAPAGGADPTVGAPRVCGMPRVRVSRQNPAAASAGATRAQGRGLSGALEFAASLPADGTELFGAARGNGKRARAQPPARLG